MENFIQEANRRRVGMDEIDLQAALEGAAIGQSSKYRPHRPSYSKRKVMSKNTFAKIGK